MAHNIVRLGLVFVAASTACSKSSANVDRVENRREVARAPATRAPAPVLSWTRANLTFDAPSYSAKPSLHVGLRAGGADEPLRLGISWSSFPPSSVTFGETRVESDRGRGSFEIALPDQAALRIVDIDKRTVEIATTPLVIELVGHEPATTKLPPLDAQFALASVLAKVVDHPIQFPGDGKDTRIDTVAVVDESRLELVGKGTTLGDLDWVAIASNQPTGKTRTCRGYSGKYPSIEITYHAKRVVIHDRRTSEVVAQTTLAPPAGCPQFAFVGPSGSDAVYTARGAVEAWVRGVLAKRKGR
jgi:hypothetical protein